MAQYHVAFKAYEYPQIARGITVKEFMDAVEWAKKDGLTNLDYQTRAVWDYYRKQ